MTAYAYASGGMQWEAKKYADLGVQVGMAGEGWGERWVRELARTRTEGGCQETLELVCGI